MDLVKPKCREHRHSRTPCRQQAHDAAWSLMRAWPLTHAAKIATIVLAAHSVLADKPSFTLIRPEKPGFLDMTAISGDGMRLSGMRFYDGMRGMRWTEADGLQVVPDSRVLYRSSYDGSVIAGEASGSQPIYWTEKDGTRKLDAIEGESKRGAARAVSDNAAIIVGWGVYKTQDVAMYWTTDGPHPAFTDVQNYTNSTFYDVTGDGSVGVGKVTYRFTPSAFSWSLEGGATILPGLEEFGPAAAWAVSDDGRTIVGTSESGSGNLRPVRWIDGEIELLSGELDGFEFTHVTDVNESGNMIVGMAREISTSRRHSWIWTEGAGFQLVSDYLTEAGLKLDDVDFFTRYISISNDGRSLGGSVEISGSGDVGGFIAHVPEPGSGLLAGLAALALTYSRRAGRNA